MVITIHNAPSQSLVWRWRLTHDTDGARLLTQSVIFEICHRQISVLLGYMVVNDFGGGFETHSLIKFQSAQGDWLGRLM